MSGAALVWAANVKGIKRSAKMVLMQLAERHNKDTGRCDPRIGKLAEDCEMHRATVLRHLSYLEEVGLLTRISRGSKEGGRASNQYQLHMGVESQQCDLSGGVKSQNATGVKSHGCDVTGGEKSHQCDGVKSHQCDPLYIEEPGKEEPKGETLDQVGYLAQVLSQETAEAFVASRKAMKKPMTVFAAKLMRDRLAEMPNAENEAKRAIRNGWQDVYPEKPKGGGGEQSDKIQRWKKISNG